ncbi:MAG TPA: alpha/beta fold hydrolase [Thermoanaerobaculia bacterium]|nr:alpha/beta fold hydrolase [Thermoanaerobaculia bacterium]
MDLVWKGTPVRIRELGAGPPLVLLHGYPLDGAMWSGVARALAPRFRVLKPDFPGRGETAAPSEGRLDDYADFVGAILEALPGPAGLAGFSMGGYVALILARRARPGLAALALVDTRAGADDEAGRARRDEAIALVRAQGPTAVADAMLPRLLSPASLAHGDLAERVRRIMQRQKPETIEGDLTAMRDRSDSLAALPGIGVPTLVVVGAADALTPPADSEAMASAIPGARLVTIPAAGHLTPMERPGAVAAALGDFFAGALGSAPPPSPPVGGRGSA